jgi:hypothetical protein
MASSLPIHSVILLPNSLCQRHMVLSLASEGALEASSPLNMWHNTLSISEAT